MTKAYQIWFVGNTVVYLFVEAFTSYRFEHYIFVLLLAGCGAKVLLDRYGNAATAKPELL